MHRPLLLASVLALLPAAATAQQTLPNNANHMHRITSPIKHAGVYNVATGTWTRGAGATDNIGPDVLYNNSRIGNYFNTAYSGNPVTDEGRIPTVGGAPAGALTRYTFDGMDFAYCTLDMVGNTVSLDLEFYDSYVPGTDPAATMGTTTNSIGAVQVVGMPGTTMAGVAACWLVTLDFAGGLEMCLEGDGGPLAPGYAGNNPNEDLFGWSFTLGTVGGLTGPVPAGDPSFTTSTPGAYFHGGGGTFYDAGGLCAVGETGLDTVDVFYGTPDPAIMGSMGPGPYFFGGYLNNTSCMGIQTRAFGSFYSVLYGTNSLGDCTPPGSFSLACDPANPNSTGTWAKIESSSFSGPGVFHLECADGPPNQFGYFLISATVLDPGIVPPNGSQGMLCLGGPQGRYSPASAGLFMAPELNSIGQFDAQGVMQNLNGTSSVGSGFDVPSLIPISGMGVQMIMSGQTWAFQCWYRDNNPSQTSNFSNVATVTF